MKGADTSFLIFTTEEPKVLIGGDWKIDEQKLAEEGYWPIGYSSFHGPQINQQQAIDKAKELKAAIVVLYSRYLDTKSGYQPVVLPDTQTTRSNAQVTASGSAYGSGGWATGSATAYGTGSSTTYGTKTVYQPFSIDRFDQGAIYWVKKKPGILGTIPTDLPPEIRQKIGSNKGVLVFNIVKGSPAFAADIMRGDIIKKVNNIEIIDLKQFSEVMAPNANKKITITVLRDGKEIVKEVKLNPLPEGVNPHK
jgi:membrane-associated protease RseP (regulator of RpoE activity)